VEVTLGVRFFESLEECFQKGDSRSRVISQDVELNYSEDETNVIGALLKQWEDLIEACFSGFSMGVSSRIEHGKCVNEWRDRWRRGRRDD